MTLMQMMKRQPKQPDMMLIINMSGPASSEAGIYKTQSVKLIARREYLRSLLDKFVIISKCFKRLNAD